MLSFLNEIWMYAKERKKFWLLPLILLFVVLGVLMFFAQSSVLVPFIYTIF